MTKDEALDLALEALEYASTGNRRPEIIGPAMTAIKQARALDKMAENARELGLDYEPVWDNLPSNKDVEEAMRMKRLQRLTTPPAQPASEEDMKVYRAIADNYRKDLAAAPTQEHQINQLDKFKDHVLANANALGVVLDAPAAPMQEPVAWADVDENGAISGLRYWSEPDNRYEVALYPAPPAQPIPVQKPFGYFKAEPFGWTDCAETDEGAIALYEHPTAPMQEPPPECQTEAEKRAYAFGWWKALEANRATPVQEPFDHKQAANAALRESMLRSIAIAKHTVSITPPTAQRQWVGLTDEEIWAFWWNKPEVLDGEDDSMEAQFVAAVRAIEAKLKEKNGD